jgi:hypothetical protein
VAAQGLLAFVLRRGTRHRLLRRTPPACCIASTAAGIDSSNLASIFEEHVVLPHLDPFQPVNCSFGLKDKVFNFGTLIAQLPELSAPDPSMVDGTGAAAKKGARPGASAKAGARASVTAGSALGEGAPVAAVQKAQQPDTGSMLDDPAAVKANLKFINPKKVPCTVNFNIQPQIGNQPGAAQVKWLKAWCSPAPDTSTQPPACRCCNYTCKILTVTLTGCLPLSLRCAVPYRGVPQQHRHPASRIPPRDADIPS